mgnify:CR=1 FL=1
MFTGACLEDKQFPKTNSLHDGRAQPLADIDEFALKIKVRITLGTYFMNRMKADTNIMEPSDDQAIIK